MQTLQNTMIDQCCKKLEAVPTLNDARFNGILTATENATLSSIYHCSSEELDAKRNAAREEYMNSHHHPFLREYQFEHPHTSMSIDAEDKQKIDEAFRHYMKQEHHDTDGHLASAEIAKADTLYNSGRISDLTERMTETYRTTVIKLIKPNSLWF